MSFLHIILKPLVHLWHAVYVECTHPNIKEIKNAPSALLSYISTQDFLRTREQCS